MLLLNLSLNLYNFQMTSSDKDFRFMATNDLMAELQKDSIKLDDDSERKVSLHCVIEKTLVSNYMVCFFHPFTHPCSEFLFHVVNSKKLHC